MHHAAPDGSTTEHLGQHVRARERIGQHRRDGPDYRSCSNVKSENQR
jgi:hypothetical protein